jgi:hypothetical protein
MGASYAVAAVVGRGREALGSQVPPLPPPIPRVNGGINIQPVRRFEEDAGFTEPLIVPELVDIQMRRVYELGFEWIRITISFDGFGPEFLAAIPYVRAARALGINVLGILGQFGGGRDLMRALARPQTREEVLRVYLSLFDYFVPPASPELEQPGAFALQILNEPTHFTGVTPHTYVRAFLAPVFNELKIADPQLFVVSAAEVGNADGFLRTRAMLDAGMENFCDAVAYHIYDRRWISSLAGMTTRPVWVTESGVIPPERHLDWITETFDEIRNGIEGVEEIFYFQLFDKEPERFRLIDIAVDADGSFSEAVESPAAIDHFSARVAEATGTVPHATYRDLIPDITRYFPTNEDLAVIRTTSFGRETWGS